MSTREYPSGPPEQHAAWCRAQLAMVRDGGIWLVPRSGMGFTRRGDTFVWTVAMPWLPEMEGTVTAEQLREQQESEFESIREHFAAAGIEVVRADV